MAYPFLMVDNMAFNLNNLLPAAPAGGVNVKFQEDGAGNISAYTDAAPKYRPSGFAGGVFDADQVILYLPVIGTVFFPANFGQGGADPEAKSRATLLVAPSDGSVVFEIKNGYTVGTITFAMGSTVGVFASTGGTAKQWNDGDIFEIIGQTTPDSTAAGFGFVVAGARN